MLVRMAGIEPTPEASKAATLPLRYILLCVWLYHLIGDLAVKRLAHSTVMCLALTLAGPT